MGEPAHRRGPRIGRARARRRPASVGRAAHRRLSRPAHAGCRRGQRPGQVPPAHGGRRRRGPRIGRPFGTKRPRPDRCPARRTGLDHCRHLRPADAVDLPDRRDRGHLRGHPAGAGGGAGGRRRHRGDQVDRSVAARLRAGGRDPRGLRRDVRHPGELPADARRARRRVPRARPVRPADQLRLGPVHAGDRRAGRARAPRHDAERLHVRDHLPRHQPGADVHRPAVLPAGARAGRHRHQHRRGQLPDHRGRGGRGPHRGGVAAAERVLRPRGGPGRRPARARARVRDQSRRCPIPSCSSWRTPS